MPRYKTQSPTPRSISPPLKSLPRYLPMPDDDSDALKPILESQLDQLTSVLSCLPHAYDLTDSLGS